MAKNANRFVLDCMFLSCHMRVLEWIYTLVVTWMPRSSLLETGAISELSLSDYNEIRTHNHLVRKRTLDNLAKWPVWLNGWVCVYELSSCGFESLCSHLGLFLVMIVLIFMGTIFNPIGVLRKRIMMLILALLLICLMKKILNLMALIHLMPLVSFYTPWKHQKTYHGTE